MADFHAMPDLGDAELVERFRACASTATTRHFYRGWLDHELRMNRCADCGRWHHPPRPMCPLLVVERRADAGERPRHGVPADAPAPGPARTGRRLRAGPTRSPPSSSRSSRALRITSTVVDCPPERLAIGMPVELDVDRAQRRALPRVSAREPRRPAREAQPDQGPGRHRRRRHAPASPAPSDRSSLALALEAATAAIRDAGLTAADIDGVVAVGEPGAPGPDMLGGRRSGSTNVTHFTRPPPVVMFSFVDAMNAVFAGSCDTVLVVLVDAAPAVGVAQRGQRSVPSLTRPGRRRCGRRCPRASRWPPATRRGRAATSTSTASAREPFGRVRDQQPHQRGAEPARRHAHADDDGRLLRGAHDPRAAVHARHGRPGRRRRRVRAHDGRARASRCRTAAGAHPRRHHRPRHAATRTSCRASPTTASTWWSRRSRRRATSGSTTSTCSSRTTASRSSRSGGSRTPGWCRPGEAGEVPRRQLGRRRRPHRSSTAACR